MAAVTISSVSKSYDKSRWAIDEVSLEIAHREFLVLLGPSGCGKTTLLRTIAGLETPDRGEIRIGNRDVTFLPPRKRPMSMVFQSYALFPHLTVADNIAFGLRLRKLDRSTIDRRLRDVSQLVELSDVLQRRPHELSGGQRQRVAVARALVMEPEVLLMDEPLSNLDSLLRLQFRSELKRLVAQLGITTIYVTHDQVEAMSLGDRVAVMRAGRILQCAPPDEVYGSPASAFIGTFIGNPPMNVVRCTVATGDDGGTIALRGEQVIARLVGRHGLHPGQTFDLGIRADDIRIAEHASEGAFPARVQVIENLGPELLITALVEGQPLKLLRSIREPVAVDSTVWLSFPPAAASLFDAETGARIVETCEG